MQTNKTTYHKIFARNRLGLWVERIEKTGFLVLLLFTIVVGIARQPYYPATWIDEGFVMQGAINLVQYGEYAMRSTEGFRVFDQPLIANGPGLVLPISLVFKLFGIGLLQARLVMVVFMASTITMLYIVTRHLYGGYPALVASVFALLIPTDGFLYFGRQAIGAIPAIFYFLGGFYLWIIALERDQSRFVLGAGLLFGLAGVTKGQYLLLIPMIVLAGITDHFYYRSKSLKKIASVLVIMLVCLLVWYGIQYFVLGYDAFMNNMAALRSSSRETVTALRPIRYPGNLWYLVYSGILLVVVPSWCMGVWGCLKRGKNGLRLFIPVIFIPSWLVWFAFLSVGWHRYALDPYLVGCIFAGVFVYRLVTHLNSRVRTNGFTLLDSQKMRKIGKVYIALLAVYAVFGLGYQIYKLASRPDTSPHAFSNYLVEHLAPGSVIETWEWEIASLAPSLTYHHPTNDWVDAMTRKTQFNEEVTNTYDLSVNEPDYLIDGPFSKWTEMYASSITGDCCEKIISMGLYDLYKVK